MSNNPYVKPLKPFDPKKDLIVSESFKVDGASSKSDTLSDLESEDIDEELSSDAGREYCSFKTGGSVLGGIKQIETALHRIVLLVGNKRGELYLLTPDNKSLKPIMKSRIQGSIIRTPAYADGIIYCTTREGVVFAINTGLNDATGDSEPSLKPQIIWQQRMQKGILTEPIATGKILIIATLGGLYAYEAYYQGESAKSVGRPLWEKPLDGTVSTPRIHSGTIYIGSEDEHLYAFEYGGSKISHVWKYKANDAIRAKPCISQKGDCVLAASIDGSVYCLSIGGDKLKWIFIVKSSVYSNIISRVIGDQEFFYFGADNGFFYCLNNFGKKVWEFKTNGKIRTEAVISGSAIYFGCEDNNLYSLNAKTGSLNFKFSTDGNINGSPVIVDNLLFFGSTDSFIHGVNI
jgi:outer membrane protein assembly factor BamB